MAMRPGVAFVARQTASLNLPKRRRPYVRGPFPGGRSTISLRGVLVRKFIRLGSSAVPFGGKTLGIRVVRPQFETVCSTNRG